MWIRTAIVSFPSLFAQAASKEAWVVDVWNSEAEGSGLISFFSGLLNDYEVESLEPFFPKLQD